MLGNRIADLGIGHDLDIGNDVADFAGRKPVDLLHFRREHSDIVDLVDLAVGHQADLHSLVNFPVDDSNKHQHPAIHVEPGVK